jgi:ParB/RepB/Spo0J family partition protein
MTDREVMLEGDRPFGEAFREELEKEAEAKPIQEIPLAELEDNPYQKLARPTIDEQAMQELVSSILENGFYGALLARRKKGSSNRYELAYGHRRKEAALRAGLNSVPVKILDLSDEKMARVMASENFSRENLSPIGEANVIGLLNIGQNLSIPEIVRVVGKGEGWVNLRLALYNAPKDIKELVEQKPDTLSYIRLLLQVKTASERGFYIRQILAGKFTREQFEQKLKSQRPAKSPLKLPIVTDVTSPIPYSGSEENHNVVANFSERDELRLELAKSAEADATTEDAPAIYRHGVPVNSAIAETKQANFNQQELAEVFAGYLEKLGTVVNAIQHLTEQGLVVPTKAQESYLVDIMEQLTLILSAKQRTV